MNLEAFFNPRSVAVIGASREPRKVGHKILRNLIDYGFKGEIYPINPNAEEILGCKCYSSVLDVPSEIDLYNRGSLKNCPQCGGRMWR